MKREAGNIKLKITLAAVLVGIIPVSYTHLDVYKRQNRDFL